ncbi:MAG: WXG100 family type VII secretion target [Thermoflexales bacterium]|nr:WXG100 family type VII secretion target [Thermoflexales bacterium]
MPQAIANPEDLERFASELKRFNSQLAESMSRLNAQFSRLSDTWRDQEHQKFAQEFEQTMRILHQFIRASEQHIPLLLRKAQRLREYLNQR